MTTATLTTSPSLTTSGHRIVRLAVTAVLFVALVAVAFIVGRATKTAIHDNSYVTKYFPVSAPAPHLGIDPCHLGVRFC